MEIENLQVQRIKECELKKREIQGKDNLSGILIHGKRELLSCVLASAALQLYANQKKDKLHQNLKKNNQHTKPKSPKACLPVCDAIAPELSKLDFQLRRSSVARRLNFSEAKKQTSFISPKLASICFMMEHKYSSVLVARKYGTHVNRNIPVRFSNIASSLTSTAHELEYKFKKALLLRAFQKANKEKKCPPYFCHPSISFLIAPVCKTMEYKLKKALLYRDLKLKSSTCGHSYLATSIAPAVAQLDYLLKKALLVKAMKSMKTRRSGSQMHDTIRNGVEAIQRQMTKDALRQSLDRRPTREEIEETGVLNSITRGG